ncbi:MAG: hypothetical protein E6I03_05320 [Chloroflexi bacterium]|nr:MAG: hypothetical protein E6I03_05320 [Chloroflexota bacterium]
MRGEAISSIRDSATVQAWVSGLREQWGEEPADMRARIAILQRFCASSCRAESGGSEQPPEVPANGE